MVLTLVNGDERCPAAYFGRCMTDGKCVIWTGKCSSLRNDGHRSGTRSEEILVFESTRKLVCELEEHLVFYCVQAPPEHAAPRP